ncbi:MAG: bifunctional UDP-N-acetylmuramoyl-tripeptide:D-alanyl-D-alanine ligase/alanine racemase [Bacteroidales bacterium]|nr:bifunctional UDP-N-acetylmuramoyl-tripeptide:D-alanyl-D-alanine ligase/alanine racemase [Bacteroidales bacterium]
MSTSNSFYSIDDIRKILDARFYDSFDKNIYIKNILHDSRKLLTPENSVFFALSSQRNDGHKYINELFERGVKNFIVSIPNLCNLPLGQANIIVVDNTLKALQKLCAYHRMQFKLPVIAVTGSNGKTIVKEWLFQLLFPDNTIVRSPKSYNSQIGVPLSVWQISSSDTLGIFEAGISEPNEMEVLKNIIRPDIGIFTNIGTAHDENFINNAQKVGEKLKLFTSVETLIYCADQKEIQEIFIKSGLSKKINLFSWSRKKGSRLFVSSVLKESKSTHISAFFDEKPISISIPFTDEASIENLIHCWCYMLLKNYDNSTIARRMMQLTPVAMRLELIEGINNCTVINDAYNSDINSLGIALDFLNQQNQHKRKTIILSDILQSGKDESSLYGEIAQLVSDKKIDRIIGIGKAISKQEHFFKNEKFFFNSTKDFIKSFSFNEFQSEAILVKGARDFQFETIVAFLEQKTHNTTLEINLNAIVHNLNFYKSILDKKVKMMAMVKAFSYGTGSFEIANVLQYNQLDYLGVAFADEGKALRKAGICIPIMVMNPDESGFDDMIKYNLEPEIYSLRILNLFIESLIRNSYDKPYNIHIKFDTGMHRLGFIKEDINTLGDILMKNQSCVLVKSVFSHLAVSDDNTQDDFTHFQAALFNEMCSSLQQFIGKCFLKHILNSAGIVRFPEYHFNMVRLGLGLYGIANDAEIQSNLRNVGILKSCISQIKNIPQGHTIGYGRFGKAERDLCIATIPIGYADGLSTRLSNGKGKVKVAGKYAPIIGRVCMDMCMIDISGIPAKEGDEVIIFDENYTVADMAKDIETISYEVLTGFSRRVKRVYFHE